MKNNEKNIVYLYILSPLNINKIDKQEADISPNVHLIEYKPPSIENISKSSKDFSLELKLKEAINKVKSLENSSLLIESNNYLEYFREDIFVEYLKLIHDAEIDFSIKDIPDLSTSSIGFFINIFERKKKNQDLVLSSLSTKKSNRKQHSKSRSNSPGTKALTSAANLKHNKLKKRQMSDLDPNNIIARKMIKKLKDREKMSDYSISKRLNELGILTTKNSQFQANTVKRQYAAQEKLEKRFEKDESLEAKVEIDPFEANHDLETEFFADRLLYKSSATEKEKQNEIPLTFEYLAEVKEELVLKFKQKIKAPLTIKIYDNQKQLFLSSDLKKGDSLLKLDLIHDTALLPGRYYGELVSAEDHYKTKWITFLVKKDTSYNLTN